MYTSKDLADELLKEFRTKSTDEFKLLSENLITEIPHRIPFPGQHHHHGVR